MISSVAGAEPQTCPWQAFSDPLVVEVLELHRAVGGGTDGGAVPSRALAMDPPHVVWEGLNHYVYAAGLIRSHDWQKREDERRAEEAKRKRKGF